MKVTVSAPGKLVLFGEHAVVYGYPCIVTAMDQRIRVKVELINTPEFQLEAPDVKVMGYKKSLNEIGKGDIPKGAVFIEIAVKNVLTYLCLPEPTWPWLVSGSTQNNKEVLKPVQHDVVVLKDSVSSPGRWPNGLLPGGRGIKVSTSSQFSSKLGFGSSSASAVCIIKAFSELFSLQFNSKDIFDLACKTVMDIQKKGSGADVAASVYGGTLYFVTGGEIIEPIYSSVKVIPNSLCHPEAAADREPPLALAVEQGSHSKSSLPFVVGYSGIKADTVTLLNQVKKTFEDKEKKLAVIYDNIGNIAEKAKKALSDKDWRHSGVLMNDNQFYLQQLGVSIPKLDAMIQSARDAGAYGAKLSGAGGGDCMIALVSENKKQAVKNAITSVGGEVIHVSPNAEGVRVEE